LYKTLYADIEKPILELQDFSKSSDKIIFCLNAADANNNLKEVPVDDIRAVVSYVVNDLNSETVNKSMMRQFKRDLPTFKDVYSTDGALDNSDPEQFIKDWCAKIADVTQRSTHSITNAICNLNQNVGNSVFYFASSFKEHGMLNDSPVSQYCQVANSPDRSCEINIQGSVLEIDYCVPACAIAENSPKDISFPDKADAIFRSRLVIDLAADNNEPSRVVHLITLTILNPHLILSFPGLDEFREKNRLFQIKTAPGEPEWQVVTYAGPKNIS